MRQALGVASRCRTAAASRQPSASAASIAARSASCPWRAPQLQQPDHRLRPGRSALPRRSAPARTGRSSPASARAGATAPAACSRPAPRACAPARPGSAPGPGSPGSGRSSARAGPRAARRARSRRAPPRSCTSTGVPGLDRHRVGVRLHLDAAQAVHRREADLRQVEPFGGQRQQVRPLDQHRRADALLAPRDGARLIRLAGGQELRIQLLQVARLRHRHPVVPPEPPDLALHPALLVRLRPGVQNSDANRQCERNATNRAVSSRRPAQDPLHRRRQIVVPGPGEPR